MDDLINRTLVAVDAHGLVPLLQGQRCHDKFGQIFGVSQVDQLITGARDRSSSVCDVHKCDQRREVGCDMWHAVVVEEQSIMELGPLEVSLAKDFETLFTKLIRNNLKIPGNTLISSKVSPGLLRYSLIFGCLISPVALHEALDSGRLGCRLDHVALGLRSNRVVHNDSGY